MNIKLKESEKGNNCNIKYIVNLNIAIKENTYYIHYLDNITIYQTRDLSSLRNKRETWPSPQNVNAWIAWRGKWNFWIGIFYLIETILMGWVYFIEE